MTASWVAVVIAFPLAECSENRRRDAEVLRRFEVEHEHLTWNVKSRVGSRSRRRTNGAGDGSDQERRNKYAARYRCSNSFHRAASSMSISSAGSVVTNECSAGLA